MSDAAGIGLKSSSKPVRRACAPHVVYGDAGALRRAATALGARLDVVEITSPAQASLRAGLIEVIGRGLPARRPAARALSAQSRTRRLRLRLRRHRRRPAGAIRAIVTAPLNKHSMHLAGIDYPGHTEILAERSGTTDFAMMLANDELRVLLVTIHVALADVIARITPQAELNALRLADRACRQMGIARPRVAVAGLNPHAGEGGKFGREIEVIEPAIAQARAEASTPAPGGDTIFMRARRGNSTSWWRNTTTRSDPVKYLGLDHGVNVTVGLPLRAHQRGPWHGIRHRRQGRGRPRLAGRRIRPGAGDDASGARPWTPAGSAPATPALRDYNTDLAAACGRRPSRHVPMQRLARLLPDRFTLYLICTVIIASIVPAHGKGVAVFGWITNIAVGLLFFLHGARLSREAVIAGLTHWKLHLTIFSATFLMFPLLGLALKPVLEPLVTPELYLGILFLLPARHGAIGDRVHIHGARQRAGGRVQRVGIEPARHLPHAAAGGHGGGQRRQRAVSFDAVLKIMLQLLLPFVLGQFARRWIGAWVHRRKAMLKFVDQGSILLVVYTAFSETINEGLWSSTPLPALAGLVAACALILALALGLSALAGKALGFNIEDRITLLFCGSKKSLASGIPIAQVLFAGHAVGAIVLPLMLFHQIQLMVCGVLAARYGKRPDTPA